jgi:hypothetical protein
MFLNTTTCVILYSEPIQYHPGRSRDQETSKLIRSHLEENTCHRKLQPQPLNPRKKTEGSFLDGLFCICSVTRPPAAPVEEVKSYPSSRAIQKQLAIADNYKICQHCHRMQFTELPWPGQVRIVKARFPSVLPFLEAEFDLFHSLPELSILGQSRAAHRALNELKAHCTLIILILASALYWDSYYCCSFNGSFPGSLRTARFQI